VICSLHHANYNQIDVVLFLVFLPLIQQEELMETKASEWSYENHNSSHRSTFQWNFDRGEGNLVRVHLYLGLNFFRKKQMLANFF